MAEIGNHQSEGVSMQDISPSVENEVEEMDVDHEENLDGRSARRLFKLSSLNKTIDTQNYHLALSMRDWHAGLSPRDISDNAIQQAAGRGEMPPDEQIFINSPGEYYQKLMYNGWIVIELVDALNYKPRHNCPTSAGIGADALHPPVKRFRWEALDDLGAGETFLPNRNGLNGHYEIDERLTRGEATAVKDGSRPMRQDADVRDVVCHHDCLRLSSFYQIGNVDVAQVQVRLSSQFATSIIMTDCMRAC